LHVLEAWAPFSSAMVMNVAHIECAGNEVEDGP
jgi:hypothetical protein